MMTSAWLCVLALAQPTQGKADATANPSPGEVYKVVSIKKDGTLALMRGPGGATKEVRLLGVGLPETPRDELARAETRKFVSGLLKDKAVRLKAEVPAGGPPGVVAAHVYRVSDDLWVNLEAIRAGYGAAAESPAFAGLDRFRAEEQRAREGRLGLWSPEEIARIVGEHKQAEDERTRVAEEKAERKVAERVAKQEQAAQRAEAVRNAQVAQMGLVPAPVVAMGTDLSRTRREEDERRRRWDRDERDRRDDERERQRRRAEEDQRRREADARLGRLRAEYEQALARQRQQEMEAAARQARMAAPTSNPAPGPGQGGGPSPRQPTSFVMPGAKFSGPLPSQPGSASTPKAAAPSTPKAAAPSPPKEKEKEKPPPARLPGRR